MNKKIIQLSTKQCPPCQALKARIEKVIDKIPYEYEYISLYNGVDMDDLSFTYENYWDEVGANILINTKGLKSYVKRSLPIVMLQEGDNTRELNNTELTEILKYESE